MKNWKVFLYYYLFICLVILKKLYVYIFYILASFLRKYPTVRCERSDKVPNLVGSVFVYNTYSLYSVKSVQLPIYLPISKH